MAVVVEMGKNTPVQTAYAIKDAPSKDTKVTQQIVVGTPGTMADMLRRRQIDPSRLRVFVLDEADHMLDAQSLGEYTLRIKKYSIYLVRAMIGVLSVCPVKFPKASRPYCSLQRFPTT